jgi:hypothetical protein
MLTHNNLIPKQRAAEDMSCLPERLGLKVPNVAVTTEEDRPMSELLVGTISGLACYVG